MLSARPLVDPVVLAIPRGGVVVGYEIARRLGAPLEVVVVRKVGSPQEAEYGLGAVAEGDLVRVDPDRARSVGASPTQLSEVVRTELAAVRQRTTLFRQGRLPLRLSGRSAVIVDDGIATGGTVEAAIQVVRRREPREILVAVGVAPPEAIERLRALGVDPLAVLVPPSFEAVGAWYERFEPVEDAEVLRLLEAAGAPTAPHEP